MFSTGLTELLLGEELLNYQAFEGLIIGFSPNFIQENDQDSGRIRFSLNSENGGQFRTPPMITFEFSNSVTGFLT